MMRASRLLRKLGLRYAFCARFGGTNTPGPPTPLSTLMGSGIQFLQIREGRLHQGADRLFAEIELEARRAEEVRQRPGPPERLAGPVFRDRALPGFLRVAPDLQRAGLRNPVLDVIERHREEVELAVPGVGLHLLVAAPVLRSAQPPPQVEPGVLAVHARMVGISVDPVLEGVDR